VTDRVIIPIPGIGTLMLDADTYRAALHPLSTPTVRAENKQPFLVDATRLGELTGTAASWWEAVARDADCPSVFVGRCRRFNVDDCMSWLEKVQERDCGGRARRCGAAPRAGT
jgi:hypothetical protein